MKLYLHLAAGLYHLAPTPTPQKKSSDRGYLDSKLFSTQKHISKIAGCCPTALKVLYPKRDTELSDYMKQDIHVLKYEPLRVIAE